MCAVIAARYNMDVASARNWNHLPSHKIRPGECVHDIDILSRLGFDSGISLSAFGDTFASMRALGVP